jgi:hypothetical protein
VISGRLVALHRWPVKSLGGESLAAAWLDADGVVGDRAHALLDVHGARPSHLDRPLLTARASKRMLAWSAAYRDAPDDALRAGADARPVLTGPDGVALHWDDPALPGRLSEDLGRVVELERDPTGAMHDLPRSVLVTTEASRQAAEVALGRPLDLRRFRPNLHLDVAAEPFAEAGWEGATLVVGDVELELLHPCERCAIPTREPGSGTPWPGLARWLVQSTENRFGVNARVIRGGRVAVGDPAVVRSRA